MIHFQSIILTYDLYPLPFDIAQNCLPPFRSSRWRIPHPVVCICPGLIQSIHPDYRYPRSWKILLRAIAELTITEVQVTHKLIWSQTVAGSKTESQDNNHTNWVFVLFLQGYLCGEEVGLLIGLLDDLGSHIKQASGHEGRCCG